MGVLVNMEKAIAPKLLCPISIRLYRGGPPHFGNNIPTVRGTLEFVLTVSFQACLHIIGGGT